MMVTQTAGGAQDYHVDGPGILTLAATPGQNHGGQDIFIVKREKRIQHHAQVTMMATAHSRCGGTNQKPSKQADGLPLPWAL